MFDLHSHILPGIDDGSRDLTMTKAMLEQMHHQGVFAVAATPHFYANRDLPEAFLRRRDAAVEQVACLQGALPKIIVGAEVAYFDGISRSGILHKLQLGDSGLVLIEMPFCPWSGRMLREICQLRAETGLTPVLAHIDRYHRQLRDCMPTLLDSGVLFQCNADAFLSVMQRCWALRLLKQGYIHFLGTDAHNLTSRPPRLAEAYRVIYNRLGQDALDLLNLSAKKRLSL